MKNFLSFIFFFTCLNLIGQGSAVDTVSVGSWQEARELTFGLLPKSHFPSGYLLNRASLYPKMSFANGELSDSSFNVYEWYFIQTAIKMSYNNPDSLMDYIKIDSLKEKYIADNDVLPIGVINMNTNIIRDSSFLDGSMIAVDHRFVENTTDLSKLYLPVRLFCVAPLKMEVYTLNPQFIILQNNIFSNDTNGILNIEIDLDDGLGFRSVIVNSVFQASYQNGGYKIFTTRFINAFGDTLFSRSELNVIDNNAQDLLESCYTPFDDRYIISVTGPIPAPGGSYPPEFSNVALDLSRFVEVGVWFGCGNVNKKIRKPFVIFAGYNPKDGKALSDNGNPAWWNDAAGPIFALAGWRGPLYQTYDGFFTDMSKNGSLYNGNQSYGTNGNKFLDKVRQEGYDILIVRFHDGIGYLQGNAYMSTLVLKDLNNRILNGNDVFNPGADLDPEAPGYPNTTVIKKAKHELVVAGYSAGALSTRLGLLLMEYEHEKYKCSINTALGLLNKQRSVVHRTKIWIGFDHEAQGSNTPIGQQMFMDFQRSMMFLPANPADIVNSLLCKLALDLMKTSGVATQNTLYNISNTNYVANGTWNSGHHPDFDIYFNHLTSLSNIPTSRPQNLIGYPTNCYRIAVSQGNANGVLQNVNFNTPLLYNQSPTTLCFNPLGTLFGAGTFFLKLTPYREAKAFALVPNDNKAFECKIGTTVKTGFAAWHITFPHWTYKNVNTIQDSYLGANSWRSLDADPGSTLPSHILLGKKLPLSSETIGWASVLFCNYKEINLEQHGFCPTVSGLDLHYPGQNTLPRLPNVNYQVPGNVSIGMGLMKQNNYLNPPNSPNNDFGFPHIVFPNTHYDYTPFDAIWAHGDNLSTTNYNDNTMHIEDPTPYIGEFLAEEIAPHNLYLSKRTIQAETYFCGDAGFSEKYYADFEARNSVLAGNQSIYQHDVNNPYPRQRTSQGDFIIGPGGIVNIRANNYNGTSSVTLGAGFSAKSGSIFRAYIYTDPNMCGPFNYNDCSFRSINNSTEAPKVDEPRPIYTKRVNSQKKSFDDKKIGVTLYPNPNSGSIYYVINGDEKYNYVVKDLMGKELKKGTFKDKVNNIDLYDLKKGMYLITIFSINHQQTDRVIIQ